MGNIWRVKPEPKESKVKEFSKALNISDTLSELMLLRGIEGVDEGERFKDPRKKYMHSPRLMKDMEKGAEIVIDAIRSGKRIMIYSDYDCDGVTSTVIMYKGLKRCGADVSYHVPDRIEEGYGMNSDTVRKIAAQGYDLILTCDNGISCIEQVKIAKELGMKVVVTDHHDIPKKTDENGNLVDVIPDADAVINPKQQECKYPCKLLCGAGVSFKFIHTMYVKMGINPAEINEMFEIAAIGTICDVMDLAGENRILVKIGLGMLNNTKNIGLRALIKETGLQGRKLAAYNVGFQLGPCINATGRLDNATHSVELLLCEDEQKAEELAKGLKELNTQRQEMTEDALKDVFCQIEASSIKNQKVIVVFKEDIHESLAGIVAGKVRERYNKPALVMTAGKDCVKGSGRSIEEYNMFEEISKCKDLLIGAGGHPMAAGFSLKEENIPAFRKRLNDNCTLTEEDITRKIYIDKALKAIDITENLVEDISHMEPFGKGNPEPLFEIGNLYVNKISLMGKNKDSIRFNCSDSATLMPIQAVKFYDIDNLRSMLEDEYTAERVDEIIMDPRSVNLKMDMVFKPSINEWNNVKSIQLVLQDYRIAR